MSDLTTFVSALRQKIAAGSLFSLPAKQIAVSLNGQMCYYDKHDCTVYITDACIAAGETYHYLVTLAFLEAYWERLTPRSRLTWEQKLVSPKARVVEQIENFINEGVPLGVIYTKFSDAVSRLVAIHVANALIKSGGYAHGVPLNDHPATSAFVKGDRPFSLIPLLSVYGGAHCNEFKFAACMWLFGNSQVTESSTQAAFEGLLASMFD